MKALFFGLLLILGGSAVAFIVPQVVVAWSGVVAIVGAASFSLLIGSTCGLLLIVSGLVIGYRGYVQADEGNVR